jgi:hypothetical protein
MLRIFSCQIASLPLKYVGVPISTSRMHVIDWLKLEEKMVKKLIRVKSWLLGVIKIWLFSDLSYVNVLGSQNKH